MNKYELNINGRELCKRHRKLRCGECEYIDELEKRVQELEKERSDWKGKHSILKRRYKGLQQKMNARWRYNRAVENEGRANKNVLEKFRKQNQLYKQALEEIQKDASSYMGNSAARRLYDISSKALKEDE